MAVAMDVDAVLADQQSRYKTVEVRKEVELQLDLGNLLASDLNDIDTDALKENKNEYLKHLMRDNTQVIINELWKLPTEKVDDGLLVELPSSTTVLPREKPIPKPAPPTKWEQFAQRKGIQKAKHSRMVFDETTQEWKPRWGYKRVNDPKQQWLMEVPANADPYEDQFEKKATARKEQIAKNEYQRLRNISRAVKSGTVKAPLPPAGTKKMSKHEVTQAVGMAHVATASIGKFTEKLPKEPTVKQSGKKRKYEPVVGDSKGEKQRNLAILEKVMKGRELVDANKAANQLTAQHQKRVHEVRQDEDGQGKRKKMKTKESSSGGRGRKERKKGSGKVSTKGGKTAARKRIGGGQIGKQQGKRK